MDSRFTLAATLRSNRLPFQPPLCFFRSKSTVHLFGVLTEIFIPVRKPSDFMGAQHNSRLCRWMLLE